MYGQVRRIPRHATRLLPHVCSAMLAVDLDRLAATFAVDDLGHDEDHAARVADRATVSGKRANGRFNHNSVSDTGGSPDCDQLQVQEPSIHVVSPVAQQTFEAKVSTPNGIFAPYPLVTSKRLTNEVRLTLRLIRFAAGNDEQPLRHPHVPLAQ